MAGGFWSRPDVQRLVQRMRRSAPVAVATSAFGAMTLLFVGCLFRDRGPVETGHAEGAPELRIERQMRVRLIGRAPRPSEQFAVTSAFTVSDALDGRVLARRDAPLTACAVRAADGGRILIGDIRLDCGDIVVAPDRDASLVLKGSTYRGLMRIRAEDGGVTFTNLVDIEAYVRGVLRGELPAHFHPESFNALAVAARTYALYQKSMTPSSRSYDVLDHEGSQMYLGVRAEDHVAVRAVEATRGEICVFGPPGEEKIFCTYYSSTCGGCSQAVSNVKSSEPPIPPLAGGVVCNDCESGSPFYRWGPVKITKRELAKRLAARYPRLSRLGAINSLIPRALSPDGRITRIQLIGSGGDDETLAGEDFRLSVGSRVLKSTHFAIETLPDAFVFRDGKGFGHGMGLCQYGMEGKARRGIGYREILASYYPRSTIKKLY